MNELFHFMVFSSAFSSSKLLCYKTIGNNLNGLVSTYRSCISILVSARNGYTKCQQAGNRWYEEGKVSIFKVPSAVLPKAYNYVINTLHPDYKK